MNFRPKELVVPIISDEELERRAAQEGKEEKNAIERLCNQKYVIDVAAFEANDLKKERSAFQQEQESEKIVYGRTEQPIEMKKSEKTVEDFWEKEEVELNPLDFFKQLQTIDLGGGRTLSAAVENGRLSVVFEAPSLAVGQNMLFNKEVEVDDIVEKKLSMGLNEFLYRIKDTSGKSFPEKAREAGYVETTQVIHSLEKTILSTIEESKESA